jgi:hypothetical protein
VPGKIWDLQHYRNKVALIRGKEAALQAIAEIDRFIRVHQLKKPALPLTFQQRRLRGE